MEGEVPNLQTHTRWCLLRSRRRTMKSEERSQRPKIGHLWHQNEMTWLQGGDTVYTTQICWGLQQYTKGEYPGCFICWDLYYPIFVGDYDKQWQSRIGKPIKQLVQSDRMGIFLMARMDAVLWGVSFWVVFASVHTKEEPTEVTKESVKEKKKVKKDKVPFKAEKEKKEKVATLSFAKSAEFLERSNCVLTWHRESAKTEGKGRNVIFSHAAWAEISHAHTIKTYVVLFYHVVDEHRSLSTILVMIGFWFI